MREMRRGGAATKRLSDHTHICCLFLLLLFLLCVPDSRARCRYCHDARPSHDDLIRGEAVTPTATDRRARATLHSIVIQFGVWPPLKLKLSRRGENFLLRMPCPPRHPGARSQQLRPVRAPVWADHDNLLHDMRSRGVNKVSRMASSPLKMFANTQSQAREGERVRRWGYI